jgi:hypothetical protein
LSPVATSGVDFGAQCPDCHSDAAFEASGDAGPKNGKWPDLRTGATKKKARAEKCNPCVRYEVSPASRAVQNVRPGDITGIGTKPTVHGYRPRVSAGSGMFDNFTWRNIALFVVALVIASCLMAWGMIIAIDRLIYAEWDKNAGTRRVQPLRFERTDQ